MMTLATLAPPVEAMRVDTGIGKTEAAIVSHARAAERRGAARGSVYTVDRHRLSDKIEERFAALGVTRQDVPRPRRRRSGQSGADDVPRSCAGRAGDEDPRRHQRDLLQAGRQGRVPAAAHGAATSGRCKATKPDVWITAHDMLFHAQTAFGKPAAVIIDEGMWHKGIRGIEDEEEIEWTVPLDSLITDGAALDSSTSGTHARVLPQPARAGADEAGRTMAASSASISKRP